MPCKKAEGVSASESRKVGEEVIPPETPEPAKKGIPPRNSPLRAAVDPLRQQQDDARDG